MLTRRQFLQRAGMTGAGVVLASHWNILEAIAAQGGTPALSQFTTPLFTDIPTLIPQTNSTFPGADYYEIAMEAGQFRFHPQLGLAQTWGYSGTDSRGRLFLGYLGPTIQATSGKPVVVKYTNKLPATHPFQNSIDYTIDGNDDTSSAVYPIGRAVPHLHGGFSPPQFDGTPYSWWTADGQTDPTTKNADAGGGSYFASLPGNDLTNGEAIYWYSNQQPAAMLWYHDHAFGITRLNAYAGLAALYLIRDSQDTGLASNPLGLPAGPYEIPLVIQDKQFNTDGTLFYPTTNGFQAVNPAYPHPIWVPEFFADTPVINATAYPYLNVEARRYRFRMVNGSQARFYNLSIADTKAGKILPFTVIGMEQSLLPRPLGLTQLLLAPGERADIIVDFSAVPVGATLLLQNNAKTPYPGGGGKPAGPNIPALMQFRVTAAQGKDGSKPPGKLQLPALTGSLLSLAGSVRKRQIVMKEQLDPFGQPIEVKLNERSFDESGTNGFIYDEEPKAGDVEQWQFLNCTVDAHPMHTHLVKFQVVNRQPFNAAQYFTDYTAWINGGRVGNPPDVNGRSSAGTPYLTGPATAPAPEESGWKDTAKSYPNQVLRVIAKFDLPEATSGIDGSKTQTPAEYVYHCHILEHEENDMMRPFRVT